MCDPTFLLTKQQWEVLEHRPSFFHDFSKKYIFCYFLGADKNHRRVVYDYAKDHDLLIFSIANFKGVCDADIYLTDVQLYNLSVNEFLYLINHAEMVCTDSMHATIFSIIFETNFITFERFKRDDHNSRNSRIYSLLSVMGLESRLFSGGDIPEKSINFDKIALAKMEYINYSKIILRSG